MEPIAGGMVPLSWLSDMEQCSRPVSFPIADGMFPLRRILVFALNVFKLLKLPIVDGIAPKKEFPLMRKLVKERRLPMEADIVPWIPSPATLTLLTNSPPVHDTPLHEHMDVSGLLPLQAHPDTPDNDFKFVAADTSHIAASSVDQTSGKRQNITPKIVAGILFIVQYRTWAIDASPKVLI